jgi:urea transport system permease protein
VATWGIRLSLIQVTRTLFGAQNVQVASPSWMSGGRRLWTEQVLVLGATWRVLSRTRLGLFIWAVRRSSGPWPAASA